MTKPIIAIDLDGTLLDHEGRYSTKTRDFFRRLNAEGYLVVLSSGRPYRAMKHVYEDLRCNGPVIAYNGAYVFHPYDTSFPVLEEPFAPEQIREVYRKTQGYVRSYMAESRSAVYIDRLDPILSRYFPYEGMTLAEGPLSETVTEKTFTCLFKCPISEFPRLHKDAESVEGIAWRAWHNSEYSELFVPGAHKGTALAYVMKILCVDKEDVFAFGDAENDIPMLEVSGHPYAMKGSKAPELMAHFPKTKNSVDEDGVMESLREALSL